MSANYTLGFVQRDGNMHDEESFGENLAEAIEVLDHERDLASKRGQTGQIHWYVYDADDPERGYFDEVPE